MPLLSGCLYFKSGLSEKTYRTRFTDTKTKADTSFTATKRFRNVTVLTATATSSNAKKEHLKKSVTFLSTDAFRFRLSQVE